MVRKVKHPKPRRRGHTRLSSKNQATIPVDALAKAGIKPGDELRVEAAGRGQLVLSRTSDAIEKYAGSLPPGTYPPGYLEKLRGEWE